MTGGKDKILGDNSIISLFSYNLNSQKSYDIEMNLQIVHIKSCDNINPRSSKKMYTTTLKDAKTKYNGFLLTRDSNLPELSEGTIIKITSIFPKKLSEQKGRVFIIKQYNVLEHVNFISNTEAILIKDENGNASYENGDCIPKSNSQQSKTKENLNLILDDNTNDKTNIINEAISNSNNYNYNYVPLKHLTTFSRDFCILVRVIKKSEIKNFSQNANLKINGRVFYFIVLDCEGSEMQVSCFNKTADKFYSQIIENEIYEIKGGYVKINEKKFSLVKSDYKIVIDESTVITHKKDDGVIKAHNLTLLTIFQIGKVPIYSMVDICGIVLEVTEKTTKHTRNGAQFMKKLIIGDATKFKIEFSLWRIHANLDIHIGDILLVKHAKVGDFNGKNLSTFDETLITINPNKIKEANDLRNFYQNYKGKFFELQHCRDNLNSNYFINKDINSNEDKSTLCYIKDVLDSLDEVEDATYLSKIKATITNLTHSEKNFYLGCNDKNCKKKLNFGVDGKYICNNCKKCYEMPTCYFTLSVRVKDCSCEWWVDLFGKSAESLMKMKAEEYRDILVQRNVEKLKELTGSIEFKEFYFWVKPKLHLYTTVAKKKLYASRIELVDYKSEAKKNILNIKKSLVMF